MKRLTTLLSFALILIALVFASENASIKVKTSITKETPSYEIYGASKKVESLEGFTKGSVDGSSEITAAGDIGKDDISVYIRLIQETTARFSGSVSLTISSTELKNTDAELANFKSALPLISEVEKKDRTGYSVSYDVDESATITYTINYLGPAVSESTEIGSFTYTWTKVPSLAAGNYQATILLSYKVNS